MFLRVWGLGHAILACFEMHKELIKHAMVTLYMSAVLHKWPLKFIVEINNQTEFHCYQSSRRGTTPIITKKRIRKVLERKLL